MNFQNDAKPFLLPGPVGQLEVMTTRPKQNAKPIVAVICHPHPLYDGTMHNKVVTTLAKAFDQLGLATVRFNYRGVGKSDGSYGETVGESEDLQAIIAWVKQQLPDHQLWLAGFSFGSFIAANVANQRDDVRQLVTLAPAVNNNDYQQFNAIHCPWFAVIGEKDEIVDVKDVEAFAKHPPSPMQLMVLPGVSHFFHGYLIELKEILVEKLTA